MKLLAITFVFFSLLGVTNTSFAYVPNCPTEIQTSQKLLKSFENWRPFQLVTSHSLSQIELYDGKPEELAVLKPDSQSDEKAVWSFRRGSTNYIACRYSDTNVQLTALLPKEMTRCTVWYNKNVRNMYGEGVPQRVLCD